MKNVEALLKEAQVAGMGSDAESNNDEGEEEWGGLVTGALSVQMRRDGDYERFPLHSQLHLKGIPSTPLQQ